MVTFIDDLLYPKMALSIPQDVVKPEIWSRAGSRHDLDLASSSRRLRSLCVRRFGGALAGRRRSAGRVRARQPVYPGGKGAARGSGRRQSSSSSSSGGGSSKRVVL